MLSVPRATRLWFVSGTFFLVLLLVPASKAHGQALQAKSGMVVSVSGPASDVGVQILKNGGNAVDASVALAFALAVTHPAAGNIGGGGFMLVHPPAGKGEPTVFDYRESAPGAATPDMYKKDESAFTHRAVGVPGTVRGLALAHKRFGKLPWKEVVQPAVELAAKGFPIDRYLSASLNNIVRQGAAAHPELARVYGKNGKPGWSPGDTLVQGDLAKTLQLIAEQGADAFYSGPIADLLAAEMKAGGGLITKDDLAKYQAKERKPIHGVYRGLDVYAPPPPSAGGICLMEMLHMLETFPLKKQGRFSRDTMHQMIEAMRRAFCDRALYLGDPDFTKIPQHLATREYGQKLALTIDPKKATRSEDLAKEISLTPGGDSTTHFSIIDSSGMAVANTYTLEQSYGSRVVVQGAGFLLNNEMMDFNWKPGVTDKKGTIGTEPNRIAPGKRMLSSQTPTILAQGGKARLITGSPGSRTIINTVLCIVVNVVDFDMEIQEAVDAPRMHQQWFPDETRYEGGKKLAAVVAELEQMGHKMRSIAVQGDAHSIWIHPESGVYYGAADKRINGKAAGY